MANTTNTNMSFEDLLNAPLHQFEAPDPLPVGSYLFRVGNNKADKSSKKQTPYFRFDLHPVQALDDVDTDELPEDWQDRTFSWDIYITPKAMPMAQEFFSTCGLDIGDEDNPRSLRELIPETKGCMVKGVVFHESSDDGKRVFARVNKVYPAED